MQALRRVSTYACGTFFRLAAYRDAGVIPQNEDDLCAYVAALTGASATERPERMQSLWGGYGELLRVRLLGRGAQRSSVVVKWAKAPQRGTELHARHATDASHARKTHSYDVESAFYETVAARCDDTCRVAKLVGKERGDGAWLFVFEDLDHAGFGRRERDPRAGDLAACLSWLASFHARFMGTREPRLWPTGTYWHLDTRREELHQAARRDASLPARAEELDRRLREAKHQTLVHGDAKPANFCFAQNTHRVAAVDFQYVGGGPGIRDVAYLLHGSTKRETAEALDLYFDALSKWSIGDEVETEWRGLYDVAIEDFDRFLKGWRG